MLCSCSIDKKDRYILLDSKEIVEPEPEDSVSFTRRTLVEEYTGQMCVNCPSGHAELSKVTAAYGNEVVILGIHAGSLAIEDNMEGGLMTPDGNVYAQRYGVTAYPSIVINRSAEPISSVGNWMGSIRGSVTTDEAKAALNITAATAQDNGVVTIKVHTDITANKRVNETMKYQVIIAENNIVTYQVLQSGDYDMNYVHNHVYRAAANGTEGTELTVSEGKATSYDCSITAKPTWNLDNVSIIGVLSNADGVVQVQHIDKLEI